MDENDLMERLKQRIADSQQTGSDEFQQLQHGIDFCKDVIKKGQYLNVATNFFHTGIISLTLEQIEAIEYYESAVKKQVKVARTLLAILDTDLELLDSEIKLQKVMETIENIKILRQRRKDIR